MFKIVLCAGLCFLELGRSAIACPAASDLGEAPSKLARPATGAITAGFGPRNHPLLNVVKQHTGLDFAGPVGDPVRAAAAGEIVEAQYKGQNGNYVLIRHRGAISTAYSHLARISVKVGDCVEAGGMIGTIGSTGLVTEPHLHFEVLKDSLYMDPALFLDAAKL